MRDRSRTCSLVASIEAARITRSRSFFTHSTGTSATFLYGPEKNRGVLSCGSQHVGSFVAGLTSTIMVLRILGLIAEITEDCGEYRHGGVYRESREHGEVFDDADHLLSNSAMISAAVSFTVRSL
jgi:hypothetical protein